LFSSDPGVDPCACVARSVACYARSVQRTCFDVLSELFARDIDKELLHRGAAKTPTARIRWLEEMQSLAEDAKRARDHEAETATRPAD
jgi:hypothetical protein